MKIAAPIEGPVTPVMAPKPHEVPIPSISFNLPTSHVKCRRAGEQEAIDICQWLVPRLQEKWPDLREEGLVFLVKQSAWSNTEAFFVADDTVGLFELRQSCLDPKGTVHEVFVRSRNVAAGADATAEIYRHALKWGQGLGASSMKVGLDVDVKLNDGLLKSIGRYEKQNAYEYRR